MAITNRYESIYMANTTWNICQPLVADEGRIVDERIQKYNLHQTTGGNRLQALITRTLCADILMAFSSFKSEQDSGRRTTQGAASLKKSVRTVVAAKDNMTLMICPGSGTLAPASCDMIFGAMAV